MEWRPRNGKEWIREEARIRASRVRGLANAASAGIPTGTILRGGWLDVPDGFYPCNGALLDRLGEANLFSAIGTQFGIGDGSTTFGLPNIATAGNIMSVIKF